MKNGFAKNFVSDVSGMMKSFAKNRLSKAKIVATMVACYGLSTPVIAKASGAGSWAQDSAGVDADGVDIQGGIVDFVGGVGTVVGVIMAAIGVFVLVQAFRNEDVDGKHRAGLYLGISAAMFGLQAILTAFLGN